MADLSLAVAHANNYWYRPCADGVVWTKRHGINLAQVARKRNLDPQQWVGRFLLYGPAGNQSEGLFLVPAAQSHLAYIKSRFFDAENFDDEVFICSWPDGGVEMSERQTPEYTGLNDCSHFVSECLKQAGVSVWSLSAVQLVANLRARADTKTLCFQVDKDAARRIVNSGLMTPGDVLAFSSEGLFRHCTLYLGGRMIVMHTPLNHPHGPWKRMRDQAGENNWEASAHENHPEVTLIHFNHRDRDPLTLGWVHGWWQVTIGGQAFYYHFAPTGRAAWVERAPTRLTAGPDQPDGKGYWFAAPGDDALVCWRDTGSFDRLFLAGSQMSGTSNGELVRGMRLEV